MTIDQKVRDEVTGTFSTSFCVEAGAGTGKTSLMVRRILKQILAGTEITRIVAITFTEKAAGELKQRIRQEIEKALRRSVDGGGRERHGVEFR